MNYLPFFLLFQEERENRDVGVGKPDVALLVTVCNILVRCALSRLGDCINCIISLSYRLHET